MSRTPSLGRFGVADEFNRLGSGTIVSSLERPGVRPTFRVIAGAGGPTAIPWSQFIASRFPSFSWINGHGCVWYREPLGGGVVCVPDQDPANLLFSFPRLVSAPVHLTPDLPGGITWDEWRRVGLNPDTQAWIWKFPNGESAEIRANLMAWEYEYYTTPSEQRWARRKQELASPGSTWVYLEGVPIEPDQDFVQVKTLTSFLALSDFQMPGGTYHFQLDLHLIPRDKAYRGSADMPPAEQFRNQYLSQLPALPTTTIDILAEIPQGLVIPEVSEMHPRQGQIGTRVYFEGQRLDRTKRVKFCPGVEAEFEVHSDTLIEATVPDPVEPGVVVVETDLGWIIAPRFGVNNIPRQGPRPDKIDW